MKAEKRTAETRRVNGRAEFDDLRDALLFVHQLPKTNLLLNRFCFTINPDRFSAAGLFVFPMRRLLQISILLLLPISSAIAQSRPVHTYSIVARDAATGEMGVAVQSHWFSVGSIVSWAEAGVGAVATQSFVDPAYGPLGLEMMRNGKSAQQALDGLAGVRPGPGSPPGCHGGCQRERGGSHGQEVHSVRRAHHWRAVFRAG